jgi:hypothetical protein
VSAPAYELGAVGASRILHAAPPRGRVIKAALANCRQPLTDFMSDDTPHLMRRSSSEDRETCMVSRAVASALSIRSDGL